MFTINGKAPIYILSFLLCIISPAVYFAVFRKIHVISNLSEMNHKGKRVMSLLFGLILGDIFLHLMPVTWLFYSSTRHFNLFVSGLWTIAGLVLAIIYQKIAKARHTSNKLKGDLYSLHSNNCNSEVSEITQSMFLVIKNSGYITIFVSCLENFCHGLIIGTAFTLSGKLGIFTTLCFLIHEIPYEFRDFILLMHSGFEAYHTLLCQYFSNSWKFIGVVLSYLIDEKISVLMELWLLPLIGGILLYITLGVIVPIIAREQVAKEVGYQFFCICVGIATAAIISFTSHVFPYMKIY